MATDPVCNADVDEKNAKFTSEYGGRKYHFCSETCKKKFEAEPERYATTIA
jgi:P-type Cu+ transporter